MRIECYDTCLFIYVYIVAPPSPISVIKLQAPVLKLPQNLLCAPFSMPKTFSVPLFAGVILHLPPPPPPVL